MAASVLPSCWLLPRAARCQVLRQPARLKLNPSSRLASSTPEKESLPPASPPGPAASTPSPTPATSAKPLPAQPTLADSVSRAAQKPSSRHASSTAKNESLPPASPLGPAASPLPAPSANPLPAEPTLADFVSRAAADGSAAAAATTPPNRPSVLCKDQTELRDMLMAANSKLPKSVGQRVATGLYKSGVTSFGAISTLSKELRKFLEVGYSLDVPVEK
ncbi:hypothetical protein BDK51DRAFT_51105, partial [Blyttiomyces helicus]